jgi:hypothetical protein
MGAVPASARDAVLARAAGLSGEARAVLDAAALTGTRVEVRLVESVTGCPPPAVDELLASGLLAGDGGWLRFRHEIARLAVEQAVAAHRRGAIRARILAALRSAGCDDDARMAFHAEAAGDGAAVLHYAPRVAGRGRPSRPRTARRRRSSGVPCGSRPALTRRWLPGCTTGWPTRCR